MFRTLAGMAVLMLTGGVALAAPGAGLASWYGKWHEGRRMADGCPFHADRLTAASRTLPLGTVVLVRNRRNGRSVVVEITDRGPYIAGRVIDLSRAAAEALNMLSDGIVLVELEPIALHPHGACARLVSAG